MYKIPEEWKYKITKEGNVYYCTKKYGGHICSNEKEYQMHKDKYDEKFIKKIDNDTLQKIEQYIYNKLPESKEFNSYHMRIMENGEWKSIGYDGTAYLKELIGV